MRYLSVCAGIEAATVAWHPLGWVPAAFSEIDPFPRAVLQHHYPHVPLHGDFTTIKGDEYGSVDLLAGGTPCQSFSIAGKRLGLDDPRGNLSLEYLALALRLNATWFAWENVPGVFSSADGDDFAAFISAATGIDYQAPKEGWGNAGIAAGRPDRFGIAWRVLDAQYFGVPQRRRRVFVVGYFGDWRPAAAVLFERESLRGDLTPRRETGQRVADSLTVGANQYSGFTGEPVVASTLTESTRRSDRGAGSDTLIPVTAGTLCADSHPGAYTGQDAYSDRLIPCAMPGVAHTLSAEGHDATEDGTGRGIPLVPHCYPINTQIATRHNKLGDSTGFGIGEHGDPAFTLQAHHHHGIANPLGVRRLTPRECERLQGFPDDYTAITYNKKPAKDAPRYKALGNSMAVPVMGWIGERIEQVQAILHRKAAA